MTVSSDRHAQDLALVQEVLAGQSDAQAQLAKRLECVPRILSALNNRFGRPLSREELRDLSQDTLFIIWQKLETFAGRATLESWSWRFCQHELSNAMRKGFRRRTTSGHEDAELEQVDTTAPSADYDYLERSLEALGGISEEIIRLKHFQHLKFHEIAERLDIPANTAKTRYYRGMVWLKQYLESREEGQP